MDDLKPELPHLPFAVFDEFGKSADDRVNDYGFHCMEQGAWAAERVEQEKSAALRTSYEMAVARGVLARKFMTPSSAIQFEAEWKVARAAIRVSDLRKAQQNG